MLFKCLFIITVAEDMQNLEWDEYIFQLRMILKTLEPLVSYYIMS